MRRSRFAKAIEPNGGSRERATIREALWFDLTAPETSGDAMLADWRVNNLDREAIGADGIAQGHVQAPQGLAQRGLGMVVRGFCPEQGSELLSGVWAWLHRQEGEQTQSLGAKGRAGLAPGGRAQGRSAEQRQRRA